jgi:enoyl-[acyl-carrier protein] reductase I
MSDRSRNACKSPIIVPCDVREPGQLEAVFARIRSDWGRLDFVLHSIAYAPKEDLHSRITDCSQPGFNMAMDVSCHSFIRMARMAEPLMTNGGCLLTVTFYGSEKVVEEYNVMGPVKAALESTVRYMAAELGPKRIRVHALSPGPLKTARHPGSTGLTSSWSAPGRRPRSISSWESKMLGMSRPSSLATPRRL